MTIGVIGWWSYDNQGDLAMLAALRHGLAPHKVVPLDVGFGADDDMLYRLNQLDYLILGGGTLIGEKPAPPFDTFRAWKDRLTTPLIVLGLGVDPIRERYRDEVNALVDHAQLFVVRDSISYELLDRPEVQVAPDLTFALPLQEVGGGSGNRKKPLCGVNLRRSADFDPQPWLDVMAELPVTMRGIPLSSFEGFDEKTLLHRLDPDGAIAFAPDLYQGLDLVIGTALHSIIFAVQAGVPVIAIAYSPKVRNFMQEIGLERYALSATHWNRLPKRVDEVLAKQHELRLHLATIRDRFHQQAGQVFHQMHGLLAQPADTLRQHPLVSVIVMGSGDTAAEERTLASCFSQTLGHTEILFCPQTDELPVAASDDRVRIIEAAPADSYGHRLEQALAEATGEYITWLDSGDWLADDALDCLVNRLIAEPDCAVVYADYWLIGENNVPAGIHRVPHAGKLYRRDVVGPCFMVRAQSLEGQSRFPVDSPLAAYSLWLELRKTHRMAPFHAPLLYSRKRPHAQSTAECERAVRQRWRENQPDWKRAIWRVIDSDLGERFIVQPAAYLNRLFGRTVSARYD